MAEFPMLTVFLTGSRYLSALLNKRTIRSLTNLFTRRVVLGDSPLWQYRKKNKDQKADVGRIV
jgi:hypothetical protein